MTEENAAIDEQDKTAEFVSVGERAGERIVALTSISASDVFREPVQSGDRVVITAAAVTRGGGFGFGGGGETGDKGFEGGAGGGGGGGGEGRPVAVIEITPEGTTVKPVFDFTKLGLTALAGLFGLWRVARSRRRR